jgi:hypothetical protein
MKAIINSDYKMKNIETSQKIIEQANTEIENLLIGDEVRKFQLWSQGKKFE